MATIRKKYPPKFRTRVALDTIRGEKTSAALGSEYHVHPTQIRRWKQVAIEGMVESFSNGHQKRDKAQAELIGELYTQIGQLKVELE